MRAHALRQVYRLLNVFLMHFRGALRCVACDAPGEAAQEDHHVKRVQLYVELPGAHRRPEGEGASARDETRRTVVARDCKAAPLQVLVQPRTDVASGSDDGDSYSSSSHLPRGCAAREQARGEEREQPHNCGASIRGHQARDRWTRTSSRRDGARRVRRETDGGRGASCSQANYQ